MNGGTAMRNNDLFLYHVLFNVELNNNEENDQENA